MDRAGVLALIAQIPDYPLPGVIFKDVTPISADPDAALWVNTEIANRFKNRSANLDIEDFQPTNFKKIGRPTRNISQPILKSVGSYKNTNRKYYKQRIRQTKI